MIETTLLNYRIKSKTKREKYLCYLDEIKKYYREWNIPDVGIERIFSFCKARGIICEKEQRNYGNLEAQAKVMIREFCEPHMIEKENRTVGCAEIECDECGCFHPITAVSDYVFGEYHGQTLWFPKTMYMITHDDGKITFFEDGALSAKNDRSLMDVYRAVNGLLTTSEIKAFCESNNISGRTLSLLLNWESDAVDWYCTDTVQSEERNRMLLRLVENRDLILSYIEAFDDDMVDMDEDELISVVASIYGLDYAC